MSEQKPHINTENEAWIQALAQKAHQSEVAPPPQLWASIEQSLAPSVMAPKAVRPKTRPWWHYAAAAVVVLAAGATGLHFILQSRAGHAPMVAKTSLPKGSLAPTKKITPSPLIAQAELTTKTTTEITSKKSKVKGSSFHLAEPLMVMDDGMMEFEHYSDEFALYEDSLAMEQEQFIAEVLPLQDWRTYTDSTYREYLAYDANARRMQAVQQEPTSTTSATFSAYGTGTINNPDYLGPGTNLQPTLMAPALIGRNGNNTSTQRTPLVGTGYDYNHRIPITVGVSVSKTIYHTLAGNIGFSYSYLSSEVKPLDHSQSFMQTVQLVGIPVGIRWAYWRSKYVAAYVGGDIEPEKVISAKFGEKKLDIDRIQWSLHAVAGARFNFTKNFGLYIEPQVTHHITDMQLETSRNAGKVDFTLQFGLFYDIK